MKKWSQPELKNLALSATKEGAGCDYPVGSGNVCKKYEISKCPCRKMKNSYWICTYGNGTYNNSTELS